MLPFDPTSLLAELENFFDYRSIEKGRVYQQQGRVRILRMEMNQAEGVFQIESNVRGSRSAPYEVLVEIDGKDRPGYFTAECSCPMVVDCKHTVATLLHALKNCGVPITAAPVPAPPITPQLNHGVKMWLEKLNKAATPPQTSKDEADGARITYILDLKQQSFQVECGFSKRLKSGEYGAPQKTSFDSLLSGSRGSACATPEDLQIAVMIMSVRRSYGPYTFDLIGAPGVEILTRIVETGRCYFRKTKGGTPLKIGTPRKATAKWMTTEKGEQKPCFDFSPSAEHILPLEPPWYLDVSEATCGPLDSGLPAPVAAAWLQGPELAPEQAVLVAAELSSTQLTAQVPPPQKVSVDVRQDIQPIPCLQLYSARLRKYYWSYRGDSGDEAVNLGRLEFDYDGIRVSRKQDQRTIDQFQDGNLRRIVRDLDLENAFAARLTGCGLSGPENHFAHLETGQHRGCFTTSDPGNWFSFVHQQVPKLRSEGWQIKIDDSFHFRIATPEEWYTDAHNLGGNDWFGVELGVMLDGKKVNLLPILLQCLKSTRGLLDSETLAEVPDDEALPVPLPDGRVLGFPVKRLRGMMGILLELLNTDSLNKRGHLKLNKLRATELSGLSEETGWRWMGDHELQVMSQRLRNFSGIKSVAPSPNLKAHLRPYQQEGLSWLQFLREYDLAGILADDMGLGKTIQTIAHLQIEKESGRMDRPSIVIAPTSLMTNWRQELERFAPNLKVLVSHGLSRKDHFEKIREHDVIVTSYPLLPRDQDFLLKEEFHYAILDEAQFIKNPKTLYAQIACQLKARHHLCLTGTPMENHLGEMWSLFHFLLPGFLADEQRFNSVFRRPIEKGQDDERRKLLARRVAPFILRRRKEAVVKELPPKTEILQNVELTGQQRDLYESIRLAMHERVKAEVDKKGMNRSHIIILDALLKLRQVCCDPRLLDLPSAKKVKQSGKLELLMDLLPEMIAEGRRILLFSQFTSMLELIEAELEKKKIKYVLLTGQTNDRATPVERFQNGEVPLFLISLKAGGTGLNLTKADTVIHYDPWWNPAVENQATDRAHRIGQEKNVFVYKLLTVGTVEEKIAAMQAKKRELVEGLLNEERRESLKLTQEDLDVLFAPLG